MKKSIIKSTFILLIGGFITKILSMIIKILLTRKLSIDVLSLYMLILPTFTLFITLGQVGLPVALSRLVATNKINNKNLYLSVIPITLLLNIIFSVFIFLLAPFISNDLLHNSNVYYGILAICIVIPFTSLSGICRSYFFGKEKMLPHVLSNIIENVVRLLFVIIILPNITEYNHKFILFCLISSNIVSEFCSTLILIIFLPKKVCIRPYDFKPNYSYIKDSFKLGIPNVTSNLIGSISFFLEPIILTNILMHKGYSNNYIIREYGIITGYVIPFLLIPSFFTLAISQAIMPFITREYENKNYKSIASTIIFISFFIIIIGLLITIIFEIYGNNLLKIIYKTNLGLNYLKVLSPFFILQYLQSLFIFSLNGMGKVKDVFYLSIISSVTRIVSITIFSLFNIGIYSYVISIILNILLSSFIVVRRVYYYLK